MLTLYRRHVKACPQTSRRYRRCNCPVWVEGSLRGEKIRRALDLTSWEASSDLINQWNASGQIGVVKNDAPSIAQAVAKFLDYTKARNRGFETMRKYSALLERRFLPWCESEGYRLLKQISVDALRTFQASWSDGPAYAQKNIERLRSFFRFCHEADWIRSNPATPLEAPTRKPNPTLPFTDDEMQAILTACNEYLGNQARIRAFVLVMRHSGLRIGDAIALKRSQVDAGKLLLYTAKTGTPVYVPLPPIVTKALAEIENGHDHYFWSGKNIRSAVANWSRYLSKVFEISGVANAHSHRFRDTCAVNWLLAGVPIEDVSILLGHSSIRITERAYAPWVKARQDRLESLVRRSWNSDTSAGTGDSSS